MRGWGAGRSDVGSRDRREVASRFCTATATAIRERRGLGGWVGGWVDLVDQGQECVEGEQRRSSVVVKMSQEQDVPTVRL